MDEDKKQEEIKKAYAEFADKMSALKNKQDELLQEYKDGHE